LVLSSFLEARYILNIVKVGVWSVLSSLSRTRRVLGIVKTGVVILMDFEVAAAAGYAVFDQNRITTATAAAIA
jgi:hypothetical protein